MLEKESIEEYSLSEIKKESNQTLREELIHLRMKVIKELGNNRIARRVIEENRGLSIYKLIEIIYREEAICTSTYFFPGDKCCFYPKITEHIAKIPKTCNISGSIIRKGNLYICYRPLLENLDQKTVFVLKKSIHSETGYVDALPKTLTEFERLAERVKNSYNLQRTNYEGRIEKQEIEYLEDYGDLISLLRLRKVI